MLKLDNTCSMHPKTTRLLEETLYSRRREKKLSQDTVAIFVGVTRNCIQQIECHEHLPHLSTLMGYIDAMGLTDEEYTVFMNSLRKACREDISVLKEEGIVL